jgi:pyrroline-5-carboxylate reductase
LADIATADIVILAVKPFDVTRALDEVHDALVGGSTADLRRRRGRDRRD